MLVAPASVYNDLKHIKEIEPFNDIAIIDSLQYFPDNFGLSLIHRHFNLNKEECVVTTVGKTKYQSRVTKYDKE